MIDRVSLKQSAKDKLKDKWGTGVLITLIYFVITSSASAVFNIVSIFISAPLTIGLAITYLVFVKTGDLVFENLFSGFKIYPKSLGMYLWMGLWVVLWSLLLIVPGIVKSISYSQSFFIIADNPNVKVRDAMKISMRMTDGYKGAIFVMGLSFLGWALLAILTLGIGFLWLSPYMTTSFANLYLKLRESSIQSGACTEEMFNGTTALVQ